MNMSRLAKIRSVLVLVAAALLLELTTAVQYYSTRSAITEQINEMAQRDLSATNRTAEVKKIAEEAITLVLPEVERLTAAGEEDSLHKLLQQIVLDHPQLAGIDFAYRVGADSVRNGYFTFRNEETGGIADTVIGFDYTERTWYRTGLQGHGSWCEPYMSYYYEVLMSTFSRPVRNARGETVAVIGADVPMIELSSLAVQLYDNQQHSLIPVIILQIVGLLVLGFIMYRSILSARRLNAVRAEKEFINRELGIANRIQQAMLPTEKLEDGTIDIAGSLVPAKLVGGDFYDYLARDGKLFFNIGDVCGKGMPAALVMSMTQAVFRTIAAKEEDPSRIVRDMNAMACRGNSTGMFATLFVGVLDLASGRLVYSNAGHDRPYIVSGTGVRSLQAESNLPIGVMEDTEYRTQETQIAPGDMVLLYTDGLTEAMNAEHELFGQQRIVETARDNGDSPRNLLDSLSEAVAGFVDGAEQSDDLTMLAILYRGSAAESPAEK